MGANLDAGIHLLWYTNQALDLMIQALALIPLPFLAL